MNDTIRNSTISAYPQRFLSVGLVLLCFVVGGALLGQGCLHSSSDNGNDTSESGTEDESGSENNGDPSAAESGSESNGDPSAGPETLLQQTIKLQAQSSRTTSLQEAPANGEISAVVEWEPSGPISAGLFEGSVPREAEENQSQMPITFSHSASEGSSWAVGLFSQESKAVTVTISFVPDA